MQRSGIWKSPGFRPAAGGTTRLPNVDPLDIVERVNDLEPRYRTDPQPGFRLSAVYCRRPAAFPVGRSSDRQNRVGQSFRRTCRKNILYYLIFPKFPSGVADNGIER